MVWSLHDVKPRKTISLTFFLSCFSSNDSQLGWKFRLLANTYNRRGLSIFQRQDWSSIWDQSEGFLSFMQSSGVREEVYHFIIHQVLRVLRLLSTSKTQPARWYLTLKQQKWKLVFLASQKSWQTFFQVFQMKLFGTFWIIEWKSRSREWEMWTERRWLREVLIMGNH